MKTYGKELILDLHNCNSEKFNRRDIEEYFTILCAKIDMEKCELFFWDDVDVPEEEKQTEPHLKGTSAVQFIMTSNITIHTLDDLGKVYLNIFSCKDFKSSIVEEFSEIFFEGEIVNTTDIVRI